MHNSRFSENIVICFMVHAKKGTMQESNKEGFTLGFKSKEIPKWSDHIGQEQILDPTSSQ